MHGEVLALPVDLDETCLVCPEGTSPDDYVDYHAAWGALCTIVQMRRLSSTITASKLSESLSLNSILDSQACSQLRPSQQTERGLQSASAKSKVVRQRKRAHEEESDGTVVTAIRHRALQLTKHPERGREFVCNVEDGLSAGVCVLVEEPVVSILDCEVQREKGLHSDKSPCICDAALKSH